MTILSVATSRLGRAARPWLLGLLALAALVGLAGATSAQAAGGIRYVRGYSVQRGTLCYGFADRVKTWHCTHHFHRDPRTGRLISDRPDFVPNVAAPAPAARPHPAAPAKAAPQPASKPVAPPPAAGGNHFPNPWCNGAQQFPGGAISQWTVPPSCYAGIYTTPNQGYPSYGWCNYVPEMLHPQLGKTARALYLPGHGGFAPRPGATVFFHGGEQGASRDGHYATVVAVGPNGWNLVVEMNFAWRGGGWQKVDFRYIRNSSGLEYRY